MILRYIRWAISPNAIEIKPHVFAAVALDLGISRHAPFPGQIKTTLGNGQPFDLIEHDHYVASYHQRGGVAGLIVERSMEP